MPAYKPKKTQLLHERYLKCAAPIPTAHGGWDPAARAFIPLPCYATFKDALRADQLNLRADLVFLDAFAAGAEEGDIDAGNWVQAFEEPDDWRHLAEDLATGGPRWLSERVRQACHRVLAEALGSGIPVMLTSLEALGMGLVAHFEGAGRPAPVAGSVPRLRLV